MEEKYSEAVSMVLLGGTLCGHDLHINSGRYADQMHNSVDGITML